MEGNELKISNNKLTQNDAGTALAAEQLKILTASENVLFAGRAATGLYIALRVIRAKRTDVETPEVILPSISCSTAANCALMAGFRVRFADAELNNALPEPKSILNLFSPNTVAVIFIHLFGNTKNLRELASYCKQKGVTLIEDLVHSVMPEYANVNETGKYSDYVIFSFNAPKILKGGGGALTFKDKNDYQLIEELLSEPPYHNAAEASIRKQLSLGYRHLHHSLVNVERNHQTFDIHTFFMGLRSAFDALMWLPELPESCEAAKQLEGIQDNFEMRMEKAHVYHKALFNLPGVQILTQLNNGENCWRFSFCIPDAEGLVSFSETLRKKGFHVSNLYWPPNRFFKPEDSCPKAYFIANRIVNFWVDDSVDMTYVNSCAEAARIELSRKIDREN